MSGIIKYQPNEIVKRDPRKTDAAIERWNTSRGRADWRSAEGFAGRNYPPHRPAPAQVVGRQKMLSSFCGAAPYTMRQR